MNITRQIVQRMLNVKFEEISQKAIENTRYVILDSVGSALAGSKTDVGNILTDLHSDDELGPSLIWGTNCFSPLDIACFINSSLSQVLDFDDTYEINTLAVSHPGPAIVPLALTMADRFDLKGKELIRAIVLGYEMCMRFTAAIEPRDDDYFGFTNSLTIGSVTSSSILLGLNPEEFVNAYGLAVSSSPVSTTKSMWDLEERPMSWIKDSSGFASYTALICSKLALRGFRATKDAFDPSKKYPMLSGSQDYKFSRLMEGFSDPYQIESISYKLYPTCRYMQSILDIVNREVVDKGFRCEDVEKIQVFITPYLKNSFDVRNPSSMIDAQFSLPYAIAMLLSGRTPSPEWYDPKVMNDPYTRTLMDKVELIPDEAIEKGRKESSELRNKVRIVLKNSAVHNFETDFAKGNPRNPFSKEEHIGKFKRNLEGQFEKGKIEMLTEKILTLESSTDIKSIVSEFRSR